MGKLSSNLKLSTVFVESEIFVNLQYTQARIGMKLDSIVLSVAQLIS